MMFKIFLLTIGFMTEVLEGLLEVNLNLIEGFDGFLLRRVRHAECYCLRSCHDDLKSALHCA
jgi:hypothetical protein